jgi:hypothetical protein
MTDKLLKNAKDIISSNQGTTNFIKRDDSVISNIHNESIMTKSKLNNSVMGSSGQKILTINQMKEVIEEIYDSKVIFDKRCYENKMPRETMEQHMYTYFNHKYGLKNLIIEWATSIINGIKMYSSEDSDICLFGKVIHIFILDFTK